MITSLLVLAALFLSAGTAHPAEPATPPADPYLALFDFGALVKGGVVEPGWLPDGEHFWYRSGRPGAPPFLVVDCAAGRSSAVRVAPADSVELAAGDPSVVWDRRQNKLVVMPGSNNPPACDPRFSRGLAAPDGRWAALENEDGILLLSADGRDSLQISAGGGALTPWLLYGARWSPDSRRMALQQWDLTATSTVPVVDWLDPDAPVERPTYPFAERPRRHAHTFVVEPAAGTLRAWSDAAHLIEPEVDLLGWTPDGRKLLAVRFDRPMRTRELVAFDPEAGSERILIEETRDTFIDGLAASYLGEHYLRPVEDGEHFLWLSERSGFHHLYLYSYDGTLVHQVTHGKFPVLKVFGIDLAQEWVYLLARSDAADPTSQHLCRVKLDGTGFVQLTRAPGRRTVHLSPDFRFFVDNHSDGDRAPRADLFRCDGTPIATLEEADTAALDAIGWTAPRRATARAADGVSTCFCALYLPPGFDPARKYPVIEVIYAGPQWMVVPRRFVAGEYGDTAGALARLGYVAVIIDSPGTAGVGKEYQDAVYGRLGQFEIADHAAALRDLARTRPWLDLERVGVHGKSWGGYFTLRAMLQAPELYKVGVASSAVVDLRTTAESPVVPYLDLPEKNPAGYAAADCLPLAGRLQGRLLLTVGTADVNTPFGHTMRMLAAFTEAGKDTDLLVFPGQHHWLQGAAYARWQRALRDYFLTWLPPVALPR